MTKRTGKKLGRPRSENVGGIWLVLRVEMDQFIRANRNQCGISANALAAYCEVNPSTVREWLLGEYFPTPANQRKCAAWLVILAKSRKAAVK